jgi:hypothetical protein
MNTIHPPPQGIQVWVGWLCMRKGEDSPLTEIGREAKLGGIHL